MFYIKNTKTQEYYDWTHCEYYFTSIREVRNALFYSRAEAIEAITLNKQELEHLNCKFVEIIEIFEI